jgi:hypothetical protein
MKAFHFLRVASVITLLYAAGHTAGAPWTPYTDQGAAAVLDAMKNHRFAAQGFNGTYWDLHVGFGVVISLYLLLQAVVLWQVASLAKTDAVRARPIVVSFLAAFIVNGALAWVYFFLVPVVMSGAVALCLVMALVLAAREREARAVAAQERVGPAGS